MACLKGNRLLYVHYTLRVKLFTLNNGQLASSTGSVSLVTRRLQRVPARRIRSILSTKTSTLPKLLGILYVASATDSTGVVEVVRVEGAGFFLSFFCFFLLYIYFSFYILLDSFLFRVSLFIFLVSCLFLVSFFLYFIFIFFLFIFSSCFYFLFMFPYFLF
jgi:hypothetical protein